MIGIRNESVQKRLLTEPGLTLVRAQEIALGMESAIKEERVFQENVLPSNIKTELLANRINRWALLLGVFSYDIVYRATGNHGNADSLSRLPIMHQTKDVDCS